MHLLLLLCLICFIVHAKDSPHVRIPQGDLRGKYITTTHGRTILGFLGIPYAASPVGDLRFQKPGPASSWKGTRDATQYGNVCLQNNFLLGGQPFQIFGNEDCLYLNVYTPNISTKAYLPVMVWIHPGAYYAGSSQLFMGPEYLLDKDIVLVTFNYRLGLLGFLTMGDEVFPGNYGMKDQSTVLRWVRDNIMFFGGNKDSVTIFGASAGGSSVNLHMMSPLSKGLFHAAISQSGTAPSPWVINTRETYRNIAYDVAAIYNCSSENSTVLLNCLRKIPIDTLFKKVNDYVVNVSSSLVFCVIVEPLSEDAFLVEHPSDIITSVPWIVGLTSEDGAIAVSALTRGNGDNYLQYVNNNFEAAVRKTTAIGDKIRSFSENIKEIRKFYFGDKEINRDVIMDLVNLYTDAIFFFGTNKALQQHKGPVYYYYFNYKGTNTISHLFGNKVDDLGVCHLDDLLYLSPMDNLLPERNSSKEDVEMIEKMVELWTNFAIYRNPTPSRSFSVWTPIMSPDLEFLHIKNDGFIMSKHLLEKRRQFWFSLPWVY